MIAPTRRRAGLVVTTVAATALTVAAAMPIAGALTDDLDGSPVTTTALLDDGTTLLDDASSELEATLDETGLAPTSTTTTPSSTTTTTSSTTTTTAPPPETGPAAPRSDQPDPGAGRAPIAPRAPETPALPEPVAEALPSSQLVEDFVARFDAIPLADPAPLAVRPGPRSTSDVVEALEGLGTPRPLMARVLAPFPVLGPATYTNDWGAPRHGPIPRRHEGVDIFAVRGTPVIAAADGVISRMTTTAALGGTSLRLSTPDGTYFYYAHLDRFANGLRNGMVVRLGDVLGYVGNTGNAIHTPPHLHFEIHPRGEGPVPPVPYLDRWLAEARQRVEAMTGSASTEALVRSASPPPVRVQAGGLAPPPAGTDLDPSLAGSSSEPVSPFSVLIAVLATLWAGGRLRKRLRRPAPARRTPGPDVLAGVTPAGRRR